MPANSSILPLSTLHYRTNGPRRSVSSLCSAMSLGYRYLGDWTDRDGNSNIEERLLTPTYQSGLYPAQISRDDLRLRTEADNHSRGSMVTTRPSTNCCATACQ